MMVNPKQLPTVEFVETHEKAQLALLMFSAFQCGTYAAMSDNEKEKARLFEVGVKAGREFLNSVNQGQITEAGVVPEAVMTLLSYTAYNLASDIELAELGGKTKPGRIPKKVEGPSNDFVLGRIFEFSTSSAYKIARVAEKSVYAPEGVTDQAHTKENAIEKYRTRNCWLVK
jgi:hypothetical protein